ELASDRRVLFTREKQAAQQVKDYTEKLRNAEEELRILREVSRNADKIGTEAKHSLEKMETQLANALQLNSTLDARVNELELYKRETMSRLAANEELVNELRTKLRREEDLVIDLRAKAE